MFDDKEVAREVRMAALDVRTRLVDSLAYVEKNCSEVETERYKRAVGKVLGHLLWDISDPIHAKYPDLNPDVD